VILDDVLNVLDLVELGRLDDLPGTTYGGRVPASAIARRLEVDEDEVNAALSALLQANLCGEEPAGYFWTDTRDPQFGPRRKAFTATARIHNQGER
jgi:hypothetical protein